MHSLRVGFRLQQERVSLVYEMIFPPRNRCLFLVYCFLVVAALAQAGHPSKVALPFSITQDVGFGNEVFVSGTHRDLTSGGILPFGVKLSYTSGNVWSGSIALEAGAQITYRFYKHAGDNAGYQTNAAIPISNELTLTVPTAAGPPYVGKTIRYTSGWTNTFLLYRNRSINGPWTDLPMRKIGPGRTIAESVFEVEKVAAAGDEVEFVFHDDQSHYDNAPPPPSNTAQNAAPAVPVPYQNLTAPYNYRTSLDVFHVQGGQVFNYLPPATVSAPSLVTVFVNSSVAGIPSRNIQIYLPRGYLENTTKRYPVAYFHDGQNVFFPNGAFGCWDADRIATYEISQGRMREAILVSVDNGNGYGSNRRDEYVPPGDNLPGNTGKANLYLRFLLDNVLPTLNFNYRTLNPPNQATNPAENICLGSSLGGLVSSYIAMNRSDTFGKIGIFSPAFWAAPNFVNGPLTTTPKLPLRLYMDIGTNENSASQTDSAIYWNGALTIYNNFLSKGYAVNGDQLFFPERGAIHNESAWSRRLPVFYKFILSLWDEPNPLALAKYPPILTVEPDIPSSGTHRLHFLAPLGISFNLERSPNLQNWTPSNLSPASAIWEDRAVDDNLSPGTTKHFWRLKY